MREMRRRHRWSTCPQNCGPPWTSLSFFHRVMVGHKWFHQISLTHGPSILRCQTLPFPRATQVALPPQPLDRVQIVRLHIRQRLLFHVKRHPVTAPLCPVSSRPQRYRALCRSAFLRSRRSRFWFARRPLQKGEGTHHESAEEGHELLCRLSALCWPHPHSSYPRTASRTVDAWLQHIIQSLFCPTVSREALPQTDPRPR